MTVRWYGPELERKIAQAAMRGVASWIGRVDARAVQLILDPPKTGRVYVRRGVAHQASAPGEAPASDTGSLVTQRETDLIPQRLAGRLRFNSDHALALEAGTRKMEPRPFAHRALHETAAAGQEDVAREIASVLK
jgi:hypothetical protein